MNTRKHKLWIVFQQKYNAHLVDCVKKSRSSYAVIKDSYFLIWDCIDSMASL